MPHLPSPLPRLPWSETKNACSRAASMGTSQSRSIRKHLKPRSTRCSRSARANMALVLVVDDEDANRELLRVLLAHAGHTVLAAANGERALELLEQERPDLVIVDLHMPEMPGTELIKRVRNLEGTARDVRIALYTGTQADSSMRDFM